MFETRVVKSIKLRAPFQGPAPARPLKLAPYLMFRSELALWGPETTEEVISPYSITSFYFSIHLYATLLSQSKLNTKYCIHIFTTWLKEPLSGPVEGLHPEGHSCVTHLPLM